MLMHENTIFIVFIIYIYVGIYIESVTSFVILHLRDDGIFKVYIIHTCIPYVYILHSIIFCTLMVWIDGWLMCWNDDECLFHIYMVEYNVIAPPLIFKHDIYFLNIYILFALGFIMHNNHHLTKEPHQRVYIWIWHYCYLAVHHASKYTSTRKSNNLIFATSSDRTNRQINSL